MPLFKITVKEEITLRVVAYVDAADKRAADTWATNAPMSAFREVQGPGEHEWQEIEDITPVDAVPDGWKKHR